MRLYQLLRDNIISLLVFIVVGLFGVGYLLPRFWIHLERLIWKMRLGAPSASGWVLNYAVKDYQLEVKEIVEDESAPPMFAVLLGIWRRFRQMPRLYRHLRRLRDGDAGTMFKQALENLDDGWRTGTPAKLLERHMTIVKELALSPRLDTSVIDEKEKHRGLCSVALVTYALGDLDEGFDLGKKNWKRAQSLNPSDQLEGKWLASYAFHNAKMFRGDFGTSMIEMIELWRTYADLLPDEKVALINRLSTRGITLHPVLTKPRHIILAGAFNDGPNLKGPFDEIHRPEHPWPNLASYKKHYRAAHTDLRNEIAWVDAWYEEAQTICVADPISLNFSHAYTGFYFTLLLGEPMLSVEGLEKELDSKINHAFNSIECQTLVVSEYVKYGFEGVYDLVCQRNEAALTKLRKASVSSEISGNKFAECIFMCAHALAAARLGPAEEEEIKFYLKKADKLAYKIGGNFYPALSDAAYAAVSTLQGKHGRSRKLAHRCRQGKKGRRILRIFLPDI